MLDHVKFIDQIIHELSQVVEATGMDKAILLVRVGQMLVTLQNGLKSDEANHKKSIEELQAQIDELTKELNGGEPIEKVVLDVNPNMEGCNNE